MTALGGSIVALQVDHGAEFRQRSVSSTDTNA